MTRPRVGRLLGWVAAGAGLAALSYAIYARVTWVRYGRPRRSDPADADSLLDRFMPSYEIREAHRVHVAAPAAVTLAAARELDLFASPIVRMIVHTRERLLGATNVEARASAGLLADMQAMGWRVLAESDREVVVGAVTRPWDADVVFRGVAPDAFLAFDDPDYVKIVWSLRVAPRGAGSCTFRTETRAATTSPAARSRFRRYWAAFSPGITVIRRAALRQLTAEAERRAPRRSN